MDGRSGSSGSGRAVLRSNGADQGVLSTLSALVICIGFDDDVVSISPVTESSIRCIRWRESGREVGVSEVSPRLGAGRPRFQKQMELSAEQVTNEPGGRGRVDLTSSLYPGGPAMRGSSDPLSSSGWREGKGG